MKSVVKTSLVAFPLLFAACTSDESSDWYSKPESYGQSLYHREVSKGASASFVCDVYSMGNHAVLEMTFDAPYYSSSITAVYDVEFGSSGVYYFDAQITGMFQQEAGDLCENAKTFADGMQTKCSASRVTGKADIPSVEESMVSLALGNVIPKFKQQCDGAYDNYKDIMSEFPGSWNYGGGTASNPALSCDVNIAGDSVYMNAVFSDKSVSMVISNYLYNGEPLGYFMTVENYTGVSADTLAEVCAAYRSEGDLSSVTCAGSSIAYLAPTSQDGKTMTLEDIAVYMKKGVCAGFLDGSYTLEDMWYND